MEYFALTMGHLNFCDDIFEPGIMESYTWGHASYQITLKQYPLLRLNWSIRSVAEGVCKARPEALLRKERNPSLYGWTWRDNEMCYRCRDVRFQKKHSTPRSCIRADIVRWDPRYFFRVRVRVKIEIITFDELIGGKIWHRLPGTKNLLWEKRFPTMPAPTAVVQKKDKNGSEGSEEEDGIPIWLVFELIQVMINPTETSIPTENPPSTEMHIDEESRPHFPPSAQTVCYPNSIPLIYRLLRNHRYEE